MLVAMNQDRLVYADEITNNLGSYVCPGCNSPVIFRHGKQKMPHFAHRKHSLCGFSEGETKEHLLGKRQIYEWALKKGLQPQLEVYLPRIAQRPDILLTVKTRRIAIEFQCSPLSLKRLLERNYGYKKENITVWWLLGSPYRRKLGNKKIAQFTQIVRGNFSLLFWNVQFNKLELDSSYYRCSFSRTKYNKEKILIEQVSALMMNQYGYPNCKVKKLAITLFQANNSYLAQCPLVCHDLMPTWPIMVEPIIFWRIGVILKLGSFPLFYSWNLAYWQKLLYDVGKKKWLQTGCIDTRLLIIKVINMYTKELVKANIIVYRHGKIILLRRPAWVSQPSCKLRLLRLCRNKRSA